MARNTNLVGIGFAEEQARRLGEPPNIAITAAGTTSADATVLSAQSKLVTMTATGSDGIRFSTNMPLQELHYVYNSSGSTGKVYPPTGGALNGGSTDAGLSLATLKVATFYRVSTTVVIYNLTA